MVKHFIRKPESVIAMQLTEESLQQVKDFSRGSFTAVLVTGKLGSIVQIMSTEHHWVERVAHCGWWLLLDTRGKCDVMADEVFRDQYIEVSNLEKVLGKVRIPNQNTGVVLDARKCEHKVPMCDDCFDKLLLDNVKVY